MSSTQADSAQNESTKNGFTSSVQDVDAVTKKIAVSVSDEKVSAEYRSALAKASKSAQVKGFREGKVPLQLVEKIYGERVRAEVTGDLIQSTLNNAAKEHKLNIVGTPQVNLTSATPGKPLEFTADVSIYPSPEIAGYDKVKVEVPKREVSDKEVDEVIDYLRKTKSTTKPLEGRTVLQKGDVAQAEFVVMEEGGQASKPEPYTFCLGEGQLPNEVEEALTGISVGETKEVVVPPSKTEEGEGTGKNVTYKATINALLERVLPELTDEFARSIEPKVATVLELRLKVRENLEKQKKQQHDSDINDAILKKLLAANKFEIPQVLIDDEIINLLERRGFIDPKKFDRNKFPLEVVRKDLGEAAADRVRAAIIVDKVAEKEGIKVAKEDIDAAVQEVAQANNVSVAEAQRHLFSKDRAIGFMIETTRTKVLDYLRGKAEIALKND